MCGAGRWRTCGWRSTCGFEGVELIKGRNRTKETKSRQEKEIESQK